MKILWWEYPQAIASLLNLILCISIYKSKKLTEWPWLCTLIAMDATIAALFILHSQRWIGYTAYFYAYWSVQLLTGFAGIGVLYETVRALPLSEYIPRAARITLITFAIMASVISVAVAALDHANTGFPYSDVALTLNHCMYVLWGIFAVTAFAGTLLMGFGWTKLPLRIAAGMTAQVAFSITCSYLQTAYPHHGMAHRIGTVNQYGTTILFTFWLWSFLQPDTLPAALPASEVESLRTFIFEEAQR